MMKVAELIKTLQNFPQETDVIVHIHKNSNAAVEHAWLSKLGMVVLGGREQEIRSD